MGKKSKMMTYGDFLGKGGGTYKDYLKACSANKLKPMSKAEFAKAQAQAEDVEDEEEEEDEEDVEVEVDVEKALYAGSAIGAESLRKAMQDYEIVENALNKSGGSRESFLMEKLNAGTITKSEQVELGRLWAHEEEDHVSADPLVKSVSARMVEEDPDAAGLVDASQFLKSLVDSTNEAIEDVAGRVERESSVTRNFLQSQGRLMKAMASTIADQQELLKGQQDVITEMRRRLGILEEEPTVRKSHGTPDPRDVSRRDTSSRGTSGRDDSDTTLTKSEVQEGLRQLMVKADEANDSAAIDQLTHATALFESTGKVHPRLARAIQAL